MFSAFLQPAALSEWSAGAAVGLPLSEVDKIIYFVDEDAELSPIACAYIRARGADRLCSYGDWAALSEVCDAATARYLKDEVSDGVIATADKYGITMCFTGMRLFHH